MHWDLSIELARDGRFTKIDLDDIRKEVMPREAWGPEEQWERVKKQRCVDRVFGIFTIFEMCQTIGWVEHTNDWDWWIQVLDTSGTKHEFDCGSYFKDITDIQDQVWDNAKDASEKGEWHKGDYNRAAITVGGIISHDDGESDELNVAFKVNEISKIVIGYVT